MNATRLIGIVLGMAAGAGVGCFISQRTLFGSFRIELYVLGGAVIGAALGLMVRSTDKPSDRDAEDRQETGIEQSKKAGKLTAMVTPLLASLAIAGIALGGMALFSKFSGTSSNSSVNESDQSSDVADTKAPKSSLAATKLMAKTLYESTSLNVEDTIRKQIGRKIYLMGEIESVGRISSLFTEARRQSSVEWEPANEGLGYVASIWPDWRMDVHSLAKHPWLRRTSFHVLLPEQEAAKLKRRQTYEGTFEVVAILVDTSNSYVYLKPIGS